MASKDPDVAAPPAMDAPALLFAANAAMYFAPQERVVGLVGRLGNSKYSTLWILCVVGKTRGESGELHRAHLEGASKRHTQATMPEAFIQAGNQVGLVSDRTRC